MSDDTRIVTFPAPGDAVFVDSETDAHPAVPLTDASLSAANSSVAPSQVASPTEQGALSDAPTPMRGKHAKRLAGEDGDSAGAVLPFRRRARSRRIRRLRRHPLVRLVRPMVMATVIVSVPVAIVWWFLTTPSFALAGLEVETRPPARVPPAWVEQALRPYAGSNLWLLPLDRVEQRLVEHPWIADVSLRKRLPATLVVHTVERREAALYRSTSGLVFIDDAGQRIHGVDPSRPDGGLDLPILSGSETSLPAALSVLSEVLEADPLWADGLSEIEILSDDDFRLYSTALPFPLVVRSGTVAEKSRYLKALLPRLLDRFETIDAVDLRFRERIIIEPGDSGRLREQRAI